MADLVSNHIYFLITFFIGTYFILFFASRKVVIDLSDPFNIFLIFCSFTFATLLGLEFFEENTQSESFFFIAISYLVLILSLCIFSNILLKKNYAGKIKELFAFYRANKKKRILYFFLIISLIAIASNFLFSHLMIDQNLIGDDRLKLRQSYRFLDMIKRESLTLSFLFLGFLLRSKMNIYKNIIILCLIFTLILSVLNIGSKSIIFSGFLTSYFAYIISGGKLIKYKIFVDFLILVIGFSSIILLKSIWSHEVGAYANYFAEAVFRLFAAGDSYYYAIVANKIENFYHLYNPISYFAHPFLRVFGYEGYSHPLGVELSASLTGDFSGVGPNPLFTILVPILFNGSFLALYIALILFSFMIVYSRVLYLKFINLFKNFPISNIILFYILFSIPVLIFFDIGVASQELISFLFFLFITFCIEFFIFFIKAKSFLERIPHEQTHH
jgi:hypothetical protein